MESIQINNKNGRISYNMWNTIATNFQNLSKLRELKLTLRMEDVISLTNLFRQKNKAVRNIEILHLIISDEPKLSMKQVA